GGMLGSGFLCIALSVKESGITDTAAFMCLDGIVATVISKIIFRQQITQLTWIACICLLLGSFCLGLVSAFHWQADLLAAIGGSLFTICAFCVERWEIAKYKEHSNLLWPMLGVQFLTMAGITSGLALCFGQWSSVQNFTSTDLAALVYTSIGTILLPVISTLFMQRYVSALAIAFLAVLEPLISVGFAFFLMDERLSALAYLGMVVMFIGIMLQAANSALPSTHQLTLSLQAPPLSNEESELFPADQHLLSWNEIRDKRLRIVLAYTAAAPEGIKVNDLQLATGWSETQVRLTLSTLHMQKYVVPKEEGQSYALAPSCCISGAMLWYTG
ncbi:MAG: DMT family transporter, partial [Ktedonobacteraceae bacterium]